MVSSRGLDAGYALSVIAAGEKPLGHLGDPLQAEPSVRGGVFLLVVFGKLLKVLSEDILKVVRSPLSVGADRMRRLESGR